MSKIWFTKLQKTDFKHYHTSDQHKIAIVGKTQQSVDPHFNSSAQSKVIKEIRLSVY